MKIAVTGVGGFVGTRLIESFHLGEGPTLAAIAQHPAELTTSGRFAIDLRIADYLNVDSLARSFAGCSAAVHAMWHAPGDMKRGTTVLCRAAAQAGLRRLVFLSSADVHGPSPATGTDEKTPLPAALADETANALVAAERQFFTECRQLGIAGYALRPGVLYGPRCVTFAHIARSLQQGSAVLLRGGQAACNCLYLDNLVAAVRLALKAKTGAGSAFLLTDSENVTWNEFYGAAAEELGASAGTLRNVEELPPATEAVGSASATPGPTATDMAADLLARQEGTWHLPATRASKDLGYRPPVSFADGMRRACAWWRFAHGEFPAAA